MFEVLETVLSPIVWLMRVVLEFYISVVSSTGLSILLLSFTFFLLLRPLSKRGERLEKRISARMQAATAEVHELGSTLKGEKRFLETEKIYKKHGYHPIQSIGMATSFLVLLPVLISAIILFSGDDLLAGESFLFIRDLSKPDGALATVNLLPLIMSGITVIDARLRFRDDRQAQYRFYVIAAVLLVLVYGLSSGLVLYWTGSNIMALILGNARSLFGSRAPSGA